MKNILNCFTNFKCIGSKCSHSCCELWHIAIDNKTLKKYKKAKGVFSKRLKEGVDFNTSTLRLKNGRCTFLNKDNLCDIIINMGDKYLSEVCSIHPRFTTKLKNYSETGVGLSCEEGARLLLSFEGKIQPITPPNPVKLKGFDKEIIFFREKVLSNIYEDISIKERFSKILEFIGINEDKFLTLTSFSILKEAELLDNNWKERLSHFTSISFEIDKNVEKEVVSLLAYFIYRHLINAGDFLDLKARTLFSLFSTLTIHNIYINSKKVQKDFNLLCDIARGYSAEIEYSEENLFKILDKLEEFTIKQNT